MGFGVVFRFFQENSVYESHLLMTESAKNMKNEAENPRLYNLFGSFGQKLVLGDSKF